MKLTFIFSWLCLFTVYSQGRITGHVSSGKVKLMFANVQISGIPLGSVTDSNGYFTIDNIPMGKQSIIASFIGYQEQKKTITLSEEQLFIELDFDLKVSQLLLDQIVITGTKTIKKRSQSSIIVNILKSKDLNRLQAFNLSEGLRFQPGLRVETNCQTCGYTQLRINGLNGSYSHILINGRPIFSPLVGLYGLEQIPTNMIERIEVIRGGGSALYGSSAIGGIVNIISKIPKENLYEFSYTYQNIKGTNDNILNGNLSSLNSKGNAGLSFFINNRYRGYYDHNGDNFSELPRLENNALGTNAFLQITENQKLEFNLSYLKEYRHGGEIVDKVPYLALQSEERKHDIFMGSLEYLIDFNDGKTTLVNYLSGQNTKRSHYAGVFPDDSVEIKEHLIDPPYGSSKNLTFQTGAQINHRIESFLGGSQVLTFGLEYTFDDILDEIRAYHYKVDQLTKNVGVFMQSDWDLTSNFNLLLGLRLDKHNFVDKPIFSPRLSFLYKLKKIAQFRFTWGTGFRAPQAFDTDLHTAFASGGISRISLAPNLKEERSNSLSASVNYDKAIDFFIAGFTIEGFYTSLKDAFYQHPLGLDNFGERFEKRNGYIAKIQGITLEGRMNYDQKIQLELGFTLQSSLFDEPVENIEGLESKRVFLRTPNKYGYMILNIMPNKVFNTTINLLYTGKMILAHFAGAPEQLVDAYETSPSFTELSFRTAYMFLLKNTMLEWFGGIKNILNTYQNDFDTGKNRDSDYIYGPANPRTFFMGLKIKF